LKEGTLDRAIDATFAVALAGVAILAVLSHRGVAPCVGLMALFVAMRADVWRGGFGLLDPRRLREPLSFAFALIVAFCLWIAATGFWSPTPGALWLATTALAGVLCAGALAYEVGAASARRVKAIATMFALAVVVAVALLLFEALSGAYLRAVTPPVDLSPLRFKDMTSLGRGVTAIAPLVFPAAVIIKRLTGSTIVAAAPALCLLVAASSFSVFANVVAILAGGAAFLSALAAPRAAIGALCVVVILSLAASPFLYAALPVDSLIGLGEAPPSWAHRLIVWQDAGARALGSCLPLGCGADYARALAETAPSVRLPDWPVDVSTMPTHPHNVFLQVWLELGAVGAALLGLSLAGSAAALTRATFDREASAALAGVIAVSFISVILEASLWQAWRLAVFALEVLGVAIVVRLK
jgi:O-antigen ligase